MGGVDKERTSLIYKEMLHLVQKLFYRFENSLKPNKCKLVKGVPDLGNDTLNFILSGIASAKPSAEFPLLSNCNYNSLMAIKQLWRLTQLEPEAFMEMMEKVDEKIYNELSELVDIDSFARKDPWDAFFIRNCAPLLLASSDSKETKVFGSALTALCANKKGFSSLISNIKRALPITYKNLIQNSSDDISWMKMLMTNPVDELKSLEDWFAGFLIKNALASFFAEKAEKSYFRGRKS